MKKKIIITSIIIFTLLIVIYIALNWYPGNGAAINYQSDEQVTKYIETIIEQKYNKNFTIKLLKKTECTEYYYGFCIGDNNKCVNLFTGKYTPKNHYQYELTGTDDEGRTFSINYKNAYRRNFKYYPEYLSDRYNYVLYIEEKDKQSEIIAEELKAELSLKTDLINLIYKKVNNDDYRFYILYKLENFTMDNISNIIDYTKKYIIKDRSDHIYIVFTRNQDDYNFLNTNELFTNFFNTYKYNIDEIAYYYLSNNKLYDEFNSKEPRILQYSNFSHEKVYFYK